MNRISVIGAGNVGATCVNEIARRHLAEEVVVVDMDEGSSRGKALDLWQTSPIQDFSTRIVGAGNDYSETADSGVVVITAGLPRKPGMSRDDLISTNANIMKSVVDQVMRYSSNPIILVVTNPLDVMTYAAYLASGLPSSQVLGMAGVLDTARYKAFLATELGVSPRDVQAMLMGGHGDTMVPLPRYTTVSGIPVQELLGGDRLDAIIERTKTGGGELVQLMGRSAWYAPGVAAAEMVQGIVRNEHRVVPACALLSGEYGMQNLYLGVPVVLGSGGVERILDLPLTPEERVLLGESARAVRGVMGTLDGMGLFGTRLTDLALEA